MADNMISAALAGQQGSASEGVQGTQANVQGTPAAGQEQTQPQVNYVTSEQLNAAMDEMRRMVQSSTDKSYNRVQKMITQLQQAGIQNPTEAQARALLAQQEQSEQPKQDQPAQAGQASTGNPEADAWIKANGGDPSKTVWLDIYDAAQEAGVEMINRSDPEYAQYFEDNGKPKNFAKSRQFVRAFEQALAAKKERLSQQGPTESNNQKPTLASSPAMAAGGGKSSYIDPKTTSANQLISMGLRG